MKLQWDKKRWQLEGKLARFGSILMKKKVITRPCVGFKQKFPYSQLDRSNEEPHSAKAMVPKVGVRTPRRFARHRTGSRDGFQKNKEIFKII